MRGVNEKEWKNAIFTQTVLQARHPATAVRLARLIRNHLELMDTELWQLVRDGTGTIASQALWATAIKHRPLWETSLTVSYENSIGYFIRSYRNNYGRTTKMSVAIMTPDLPLWNNSATQWLRSSMMQTLAQAGFLESTKIKMLKLQPVHLGKALRKLGTMRGSVKYIPSDFDAPLDDVKEYIE